MNWKIKSKIQNAISLLPSSASYEAYYFIQRKFGKLRKINPLNQLNAGIETWKRIVELGYDPTGKVFFEVGTGRCPIVPIAYWLMGAKSIITIDLNPYVKKELLIDCLQYVADHYEEIEKLFGSYLIKERLDALIRYYKLIRYCTTSFFMASFFDFCQIKYLAPIDAAITGLKSQSIDFHTSFNVFEHIPSEILKNILEEGKRIISKNGMFIHRIDYSDHFSHSDKTISAINFLQYSDLEWNRYAGNRYMYMNRMRHDDFLNLFQSMNLKVLLNEPCVDQRSYELIQSGYFPLSEIFQNKSTDVLSITTCWIACIQESINL